MRKYRIVILCLILIVIPPDILYSCWALEPYRKPTDYYQWYQSLTEDERIWEAEKSREWYLSDKRQLYDASVTDYKGSIFWTIVSDHSGISLMKRISLEDGKVAEWDAGRVYIIQKDPREYDGLLYAVEDDEHVEIWQLNTDGTERRLADYDISYPYWDHGPQTVRAYMHGTLYYIRAIEKNDKDSNVGSEIVDVSCSEHDGVLCRIDPDGNEYTYQLDNTPRKWNAIFAFFAISPSGKVAWTTTTEEKSRWLIFAGRQIMVETPGEGVMDVLPEFVASELEWDKNGEGTDKGIYGRCLYWLDDDRLLFGSRIHYTFSTTYLYVLNTVTGECEQLMNEEGRPIKLYHPIMGTSGVYLNKAQDMLAYMGQPNNLQLDMDDFSAAVPHLIDLETGRNYVLYEIKADDNGEGEFRNQAGQLSWAE